MGSHDIDEQYTVYTGIYIYIYIYNFINILVWCWTA
jgi:hypothetical protein